MHDVAYFPLFAHYSIRARIAVMKSLGWEAYTTERHFLIVNKNESFRSMLGRSDEGSFPGDRGPAPTLLSMSLTLYYSHPFRSGPMLSHSTHLTLIMVMKDYRPILSPWGFGLWTSEVGRSAILYHPLKNTIVLILNYSKCISEHLLGAPKKHTTEFTHMEAWLERHPDHKQV